MDHAGRAVVVVLEVRLSLLRVGPGGPGVVDHLLHGLCPSDAADHTAGDPSDDSAKSRLGNGATFGSDLGA